MSGRPNILLIVCDQFNHDAVGAFRSYYDNLPGPVEAWGPRWARTPRLDALCRGGTAFLQTYSAHPVCGPARSALFTGRMPLETGVTVNSVGIDARVPNLGQWLSERSDYRCFYAGKWHAGGDWSNPSVDGEEKIPGFTTLPTGGRGHGEFNDYQISNAVAGFLENDASDAPFLVVAGLQNPHDICLWEITLNGGLLAADGDPYGLGDARPPTPPSLRYDFTEPAVHAAERKPGFTDDQWRNYAYDYYRMVEKADHDIGRMVAAARARADGEDLAVIFTSDHGEGLGRHGRGSKGDAYDDTARVPLIVNAPSRVRSGELDARHLAHGTDVVPTVCELAGVDAPPKTRGRSLLPLCERGRAPPEAWRDDVLIECNQMPSRAIRSERCKFAMEYVGRHTPVAAYKRRDTGAWAPFEQGKGESFEQDPRYLLFDLENDPWELHNLAENPGPAERALIDEHLRRVRAWEAVLEPGRHDDRGRRANYPD